MLSLFLSHSVRLRNVGCAPDWTSWAGALLGDGQPTGGSSFPRRGAGSPVREKPEVFVSLVKVFLSETCPAVSQLQLLLHGQLYRDVKSKQHLVRTRKRHDNGPRPTSPAPWPRVSVHPYCWAPDRAVGKREHPEAQRPLSAQRGVTDFSGPHRSRNLDYTVKD